MGVSMVFGWCEVAMRLIWMCGMDGIVWIDGVVGWLFSRLVGLGIVLHYVFRSVTYS